MAHLTNFPIEFLYEIFTEDASQLGLYHSAKKSKMTKNSNQGVLPPVFFVLSIESNFFQSGIVSHLLLVVSQLNLNCSQWHTCFSKISFQRLTKWSGCRKVLLTLLLVGKPALSTASASCLYTQERSTMNCTLSRDSLNTDRTGL